MEELKRRLGLDDKHMTGEQTFSHITLRLKFSFDSLANLISTLNSTSVLVQTLPDFLATVVNLPSHLDVNEHPSKHALNTIQRIPSRVRA